jgi:hypothetical protein
MACYLLFRMLWLGFFRADTFDGATQILHQISYALRPDLLLAMMSSGPCLR